MFMLMCLKGEIVSRSVMLPPAPTKRRGANHRTRRQWMNKMGTLAAGWHARYYAFRYMGRWHLCDALASLDDDRRIRFMPGDAREAVEMLLMVKGQDDG